MRVIPVIDLKDGLVVRGVGGRRDDYRPITSQLTASQHPGAVATALQKTFGFAEIYVADLDAIMLDLPDITAWHEIAETGFSLLLDAGVSNIEQAQSIWQVLAKLPGENSRLVIGLESWQRLAELRSFARHSDWEPERIVFSLDLKQGQPITPDPEWKQASPIEIADEVVAAGINSLIVLDLADVGSGQGISTLPLVKVLRDRFPHLEVIAGGGVQGKSDLLKLSTAGGSAALVASALHDGRLTSADL
ncbi:HisA/HisF-related TIM barrel protein [Anatilimnocola sp. NA78]|uniref:HisA/HisF-related TIM barrel protein n=1 Tax=Anatilimnocola sp. NA78 TaxID=3415683 RepID=UPI003CE54C51